jgi:hypothetical protein
MASPLGKGKKQARLSSRVRREVVLLGLLLTAVENLSAVLTEAMEREREGRRP